MSPKQTQIARQAWEKAKQLGAGVNSKADCIAILKQHGINNSAMAKIGSYLNNPMAGMVAKAAGVDLNEIRRGFDELTNAGPVADRKTANSSLEKFRQGMKQL